MLAATLDAADKNEFADPEAYRGDRTRNHRLGRIEHRHMRVDFLVYPQAVRGQALAEPRVESADAGVEPHQG